MDLDGTIPDLLYQFAATQYRLKITTPHLAKLLEAKRYLKSRGLGTVERITPREGK